MILLAMITGIIVGPVMYLFAPNKSVPVRLVWAVVAVSAVYALELAVSVYLGDWLGGD